jgi:hypothetical protein
MSNYIKATNFATKDSLATGNPNKIIKGTEIDTEFNAIASAVSSKADINSPTFTGIPEAPTATAGTNTTQLATAAFVIAERTNTSTLTNKTLTSPTINTPTINTPTINTPTITGGSITGITDLAVADGGTGASTLAANNVLLGNGTSALQAVAPSTSGNVLTSNGTTWTSAAPPAGGVTSLNGQTGAITNTSINSIGSYFAGGTLTFGTYNFGDTVAGSSLRISAISNTFGSFGDSSYNPSLSGTWRAMGRSVSENVEGNNEYGANLWVRVS